MSRDADDVGMAPDAPDRPDAGVRRYAPLGFAALAVVVLDQVAKQWATGLTPCSTLARRPLLTFCLAHNEGMAFSVGWGNGPAIAVVAVVIVTVLVISSRSVPPWCRVLMGVVAGGALGNVIDRAFRAPVNGSGGFMRGAVVDFVYTNFWATFNVADSAIVVGGILLSIALWRLPDPKSTRPAGDDAGSRS